MTLGEAREAIVRERCEALRPQASWVEIASTLGIASKTLWDHRREIYDSSHKFHPDQAT
jgi:transposase-like protein